MLTEKENRERIFTEFAQHITSGKLTLSLEERELIVKALNYYSIAKLQPEEMELTKDEMDSALKKEHFVGFSIPFWFRAFRCIARAQIAKLSPYLLQAKEEGKKEAYFSVQTDLMSMSCKDSYTSTQQAVTRTLAKVNEKLIALSSPATEKENK